MEKDTADKMRGMIRRVTLKNIRDDGETQRASVEVADGIWREDVEIYQPYGFSSVTPEDGSMGLVLAIGGDQGDIVALPSSNPSRRMGGLPPGAAGVSNQHGDSILVLPDGGIAIKAGGGVTISVGGVILSVSAAGVAISGGQITHNGQDIGDTHRHGGVSAGAEQTDVPA